MQYGITAGFKKQRLPEADNYYIEITFFFRDYMV